MKVLTAAGQASLDDLFHGQVALPHLGELHRAGEGCVELVPAEFAAQHRCIEFDPIVLEMEQLDAAGELPEIHY
ncbi:MAG: hypothetical protein JXM73_17095 [Anaerolineae bacterium]|nr:hypothetical protein [Anaerolineae bacterium]